MNIQIDFKYIAFSLIFVLMSCSTYRGKSDAFQQKIQQNDYSGALKTVDQNSFLKKKRNELLFYMEKGKIAYLDDNYLLSNEFFNKADALIEENKRDVGGKILGVLTNPERQFYKGEDFEKVAIHYYKALNYLFLKDIDEALVEAKRITLQLQYLNEKYPEGKKNRYVNDTFALTLQGLLYESSGDQNNAFIAYRNAIDLYLQNGGNYFGVAIPNQLKEDFFRTADFMGFYSEIERYEDLLGISYQRKEEETREAVVFWENGLVPYKDETAFTFSVVPGSDIGFFSVFNEELDLTIPLPIDYSDDVGLDIFRVAFPKYVSRQALFRKASIQIDSVEYPFQLTENYNNIAYKTLKDRTYREIGNVALRLVTKKTSEYLLKSKDELSGNLLGIFNAITEGADTRNWQSLPEHIHYSRVPVKQGKNKLDVVLEDRYNNTTTKSISIQKSGSLVFAKITTPEIL
ncbi:hypothetical protein D1816_14535 [Aquimarina sp. AD10]|uniref:COG3014 family protein n=1 Tax=Aquimarina sp. AD10 TaxID=1714849 RepID=UPI000E49E704|nr:hypothetical protein [Aquimarina sp. AD10]AXT63676.1 hypothetical protein D1816_14535 [Aquimarina sp. AD10]RKM90086.1 hypothetical protein D7033_25055 [Aquimarina sp. AD10]